MCWICNRFTRRFHWIRVSGDRQDTSKYYKEGLKLTLGEGLAIL